MKMQQREVLYEMWKAIHNLWQWECVICGAASARKPNHQCILIFAIVVNTESDYHCLAISSQTNKSK